MSRPNRTLCDVLEEMRATYNTRNFSYLLGLIEEAQTMGERMEAAIEDRRDAKQLREEISDLNREIEELQSEILILEQKKAGFNV